MAFTESTTEEAKYSKQKMLERFKRGQDMEQALVMKVAAMTIRDRLVAPTSMNFLMLRTNDPVVVMSYGKEQSAYHIHHHALGQLASKAGIPMTYVNSLSNSKELWKATLLAHNLNELFHLTEFKERNGEDSRFLHRIVGVELRGFLSRRFARHLASLPLLRAFVAACKEVGAVAVDSTATDVRLALKSYLPFIFEPIPGECLAVGVEWANSDFGAGKLSIRLTVWRVKSGTYATCDETVSRVHLGAVIQDSDIEMSEETAVKEIETVASAIRDAVVKQLDVEPVERLLAAIAAAHQAEIPWHRLKGQLAKFLYKTELENIERALEDDGVLDLPPIGKDAEGKPLPTKWWATNVISWMANRSEDEQRKLDLQAEAGKWMNP